LQLDEEQPCAAKAAWECQMRESFGAAEAATIQPNGWVETTVEFWTLRGHHMSHRDVMWGDREAAGKQT